MYLWCRSECEVERKYEVFNRTTVNVEATEIREADGMNCFCLVKELLLNSHLVIGARIKVYARPEVVFEEVEATGGFEAGVGQYIR